MTAHEKPALHGGNWQMAQIKKSGLEGNAAGDDAAGPGMRTGDGQWREVRGHPDSQSSTKPSSRCHGRVETGCD